MDIGAAIRVQPVSKAAGVGEVNAESIPKLLKDKPSWLVWKKNEDGKKVPYYTSGIRRYGKQNGPEDRSRLRSFDEAMQAYETGKYSGIGLAMSKDLGLVGVDLDHCLDDGKLKPELAQLIEGTYAEISVSGKGVHAFYLGNYPDRKAPEDGVEIFCDKGYLTITGNVLQRHPITPLPNATRDQLDKLFEKQKNTATPPNSEEDATWSKLSDKGLIKKDLGNGKFAIDCPFKDQHTSGNGIADCVYFLPHYGGYKQGHFKCLHAHCEGRTDEEFLQAIGIEPSISSNEPAIQKVTRFSEALLSGPELDTAFRKLLSLSWRIKNVIPESAKLIEIYGLPATYKSFIALDMALCISAGLPWAGKNIKQCRVVYIPAEGQSGTLKRIMAWRQLHKVEKLPYFCLLPTPCLIDEPTQLDGFIEALSILPEPPGIIFFDTLARSMGGDENATVDMGKVVNACGRLTEETDAQIVLVHHTGKDTSRGPRGAIALTGATDCLFEVKKVGDKVATLICERQKDDEPFQNMTFRMEVQTTGFLNNDKEELFSLVPVLDSDAAITTNPGPRISNSQKIALDALNQIYLDNPVEAVHLDEWRAVAYRSGITASTDIKAKQKAFKRAVTALLSHQFVRCENDCYKPC